MDNLIGSKKLRETIRLLERKLGMLDDLQSSCCGITFAQCHAIVEIGRAETLSLNDLANIRRKQRVYPHLGAGTANRGLCCFGYD